ncbi:MAG: hypothetical protein OHK0015_04200 [Chloroflexi bacterium OHK40]|jgi:ElaB/YqjD/DUF883 family membrane-anchored ribosome-binding protein
MSQPDDTKNQSQHPQSDLASELRELGQQLEQAVRSSLESERAKQLQADIASGLREIGAQLQHAMHAIQENPQVQQFVQRGEQAVNQAQQSKVAKDFQETLARGVAMLNDQLAGFVARMRQQADESPPSGDASTGETTRLDPEKQ